MTDSIFDNNDLIYSYTDAQALEDGLLIDISPFNLVYRDLPVNRITITITLYVELFALMSGNSEAEKMSELRRTINTKLEYATYKGRISEVPPDLWLVLNEVGGWTLMFPSDY